MKRIKRKGENYLKKAYFAFFNDLSVRDFLTYYYYTLTFRRQKLHDLWADEDQELKEKELLSIIKQMDSEFEEKIYK